MFKSWAKRLVLGATLLFVALPGSAQYVCFPTCAPLSQATVDGKFLSLAGSALATFNSDAVTVVFGLPATATDVQFGVFDGNTTGQWESAAGTINLTYTLYEDPLATGTGPVQVAQWVETDFPDNAWLDLSVPVGPGALAPSGTAYFYRLRIEASNAQPLAWTNFKVRTPDTNSLSLKPQAFNFTGARFTAADLAVIYPAFPTLTPTRYDGRWQFFARIGASTDTAEFWDGDLDRGSANCTSNDTDDPDTPGAPFLPPWAAGTSAFEGIAVGEARPCGTTTGSPPDDVDFASFLRTPSVTYTVEVPGDPTPYLNANPSGNLEWERFALTTIPGSVPATADHEVAALPSGIYLIDMQGMDMRNFNSWFIPFDILGVCEENGNDGPETPTPCGPDFSPFLVGDFVWRDLNGDGVQDGGEPGIPGVAVCLLDQNGNLVDGTGDSGGGCVTTDANGAYQFEVEAGTYTVRIESFNFDPGLALEGLSSTTGGEEQTYTVFDDNVLTYDFGYNGQANDAALGDRVWYDTNGDGIQDGGENGIAGVTVRLLDAGGNEITTDITDANGIYGFTGLAAGNYTVEIDTTTLPAGLAPTYDLDGIATAHTAAATLAASQARDDVDFGYRGTASLGDRVWLDLDGDGVQDGGGETGINGVTVELLDGGGNVVGSAVTSGDGNYTFANLDAATYSVRVVTATLPAGLAQTFDLDGIGTAHIATATLTAGQNRTDVDFGYRGTASLGDRVWLDLDGDGVQDGGGETGINGVTVELLDGGGNGVGSAVTSGDGNYTFANLDAGTYSVRVVTATLPAGLAQTYDLNGIATANIATATLAAGENRTDVDFGYRGTASLGDRVWLDLDGDGVQDGGGEAGINGVTVELLDGGGNVVGSAVTSGDGNYGFSNLGAGTYSVRVVTATLPAGLAQTFDLDGIGTAHIATATLTAGQNRTDVDFGYRGTASVGDRLWNDADGDGVQDGGEAGLNGVTVELLDGGGNVVATQVTAGDGNYTFGNLNAGNYSVRVVAATLPAGLAPTFDLDGIGTANTASFALAAGQTRTDVDFGYRGTASVGDRLWNDADGDGVQDGGEAGLNGVTVELLDGGGNVVGTQVTAGDGNYTFGNLNAGNYSVRVVAATLPAGLAPTFDLDGTGTANTASFALAAGQNRTDVDFGYQQPPANGSLGDRVWNDLDNDGVQDAGENGINGITVQLLNAGGTVIATQVTAGDGNYNFTGLAAGTYSVRIVTATIPAGFVPTYDLDGLGTLHIATVTLATSQNRTDVDFGYWCPPGKGSIGDRVWNDLDADGVQDGGEPGLNGVTVELLDATGAVLATQVTAGNGNYLFPNLAAGNYTVRVVSATLPSGYAATYDLDGIATQHTAAVTLADGQDRTDVDFGYANAAICVGGDSQILHPPSGGIIPWPFGPGIRASSDLFLEIVPDPAGDYARFRIVNTSQNLPENGEESGPDAISFNLPQALTAANITVIGPSTFKELRSGTTPGDIFGEFAWEVRRNEHNDTPFVFELRVPGVDLTEAAFGYNDHGQRFIMRINGIFYNGENEDRAFSGCVPSKLGSLGDRVWEDYDSDGIQDAGEPGLNGVTVRLKDALGNVLATQVTSGDGSYLFSNLVASPYTVQVDAATVPGGLFPTYDRDGVATPHVATVSLSEGQNRTDVDFGYNKVKLGSLGDRVWYDNDADGVQDSGEGGINGVTVRLKNSGGTVIATQVTSGNGNYLFTDLLAGTYTVEVDSATLPGGLVQTYDLDGTGTAHRATTTLTEGQNRTNVDFGYAKVVGGSIGDRVWFDIDRDGVQDAGEPGWNGRTVRLRSGGASGTILQTQVTSGDGNYLFINLGAGTYTVEVVVTGVADLVRTFDLDGTSSANRATFTLAANQNRRDVDFGYAIKVKPILECVVDNKDDTFTAYFGYQNSMTAAVPIAVGSRNKFSPNPTNRNQPTVFQPGRTSLWPNAALAVTAQDWQTLTWTLDGKTASATDKSTPCSYHVFFEKEWVDAEGNISTVPPATIAPDFEIYAESQVGKVHCFYPKDSTKLTCEYWNQQPPATDNQGLWVPVGTEYWVTEKNLPAGWNPTSGVGTFPIPNGECVPGRDGFENYCTHTVTNSQVPSVCADRATYDPVWGQYFGNHALWLPEIATDLVFDPRGRFYEFDNGSARLTGVVRSLSDPKMAFEVDLIFTGKTTTGTPVKELKPAAYSENGGPINPATWYYYPNWEGSLIGIDDMAGADLWIYHDMPFQIGFGANGKNLHYGASGWLGWDVKAQPKNGTKLPTKGKGDINIDIKDCPAVILAPVPN